MSGDSSAPRTFPPRHTAEQGRKIVQRRMSVQGSEGEE